MARVTRSGTYNAQVSLQVFVQFGFHNGTQLREGVQSTFEDLVVRRAQRQFDWIDQTRQQRSDFARRVRTGHELGEALPADERQRMVGLAQALGEENEHGIVVKLIDGRVPCQPIAHRAVNEPAGNAARGEGVVEHGLVRGRGKRIDGFRTEFRRRTIERRSHGRLNVAGALLLRERARCVWLSCLLLLRRDVMPIGVGSVSSESRMDSTVRDFFFSLRLYRS